MPRDIGTGLYHYPDGTPGNPGQTIFSTRYNTFINDLTNTLNQALPVNMGGTGGDNSMTARANLNVEVAGQIVTNYDTHIFEAGSFNSSPGAVNEPVVGQYFSGFCIRRDSSALMIVARQLGVPSATAVYTRERNVNVWGPWRIDGDDRYVNIAGDTMTGHLSLPTGPLNTNAVRRDYVDAADATNAGNIIAGDALKVAKAGDTMSGNLTISAAYASVALNIPDQTSGSAIVGGTNGVTRWTAYFNAPSNSDLQFMRHNDAGTFIDVPLTISRATGLTKYISHVQTVATGQQPAFSSWSTATGCWGFWAASAVARMEFGACDGAGVPISAGAWMSLSQFAILGEGYKPGGGPWVATSDERVKTVNGNYENGLDAIKTLQPVRYTFKGNDTQAGVSPSNYATTPPPDAPVSKDEAVVPYANSPHYVAATSDKEYIGLIAQACEAAFPEMVSQHDGMIDGQPVADLRSLDTGPLIFALVNAVKEMAARIEALEAAQAPP